MKRKLDKQRGIKEVGLSSTFPKCYVRILRLNSKNHRSKPSEGINQTEKDMLCKAEAKVDEVVSEEKTFDECSVADMKQINEEIIENCMEIKPPMVSIVATDDQYSFSFKTEKADNDEIADEMVDCHKSLNLSQVKSENVSNSNNDESGFVNEHITEYRLAGTEDYLSVKETSERTNKIFSNLLVELPEPRIKEDVCNVSILNHGHLKSYLEKSETEDWSKKVVDRSKQYLEVTSLVAHKDTLENLINPYLMNYVSYNLKKNAISEDLINPTSLSSSTAVNIFPEVSSFVPRPVNSNEPEPVDYFLPKLPHFPLGFQNALDCNKNSTLNQQLPNVCQPKTIDAKNNFNSATVTQEEIVSLSVTEFNRRLRGLPKELREIYKRQRRTLKNRGYATTRRIKVLSSRQELEVINKELSCQNNALLRKSEEDSTKIKHLKKLLALLMNENMDLRRIMLKTRNITIQDAPF